MRAFDIFLFYIFTNDGLMHKLYYYEIQISFIIIHISFMGNKMKHVKLMQNLLSHFGWREQTSSVQVLEPNHIRLRWNEQTENKNSIRTQHIHIYYNQIIHFAVETRKSKLF